DGTPLPEQFTERFAVFRADLKPGPAPGALPDREVIGDAVDDADGRGAALVGALNRLLVGDRLIEDARREVILDDDRLALDVASQVVGRAAGPQPDHVELAARWRRGVDPGGWPCR